MLRERLGLPGAKNACEQGECGSCSVLVDGALVCACLVLAAARGRAARSSPSRALPSGDGDLTDVQQAFVDEGAVQCGFCTPGLVWRSTTCSTATPRPTELEVREAISGNLCRCTGYGRILAAAQAVVAERSGAGRSQREAPA